MTPFPLSLLFAFLLSVLSNDLACFAFFYKEHCGHFGMKC